MRARQQLPSSAGWRPDLLLGENQITGRSQMSVEGGDQNWDCTSESSALNAL